MEDCKGRSPLGVLDSNELTVGKSSAKRRVGSLSQSVGEQEDLIQQTNALQQDNEEIAEAVAAPTEVTADLQMKEVAQIPKGMMQQNSGDGDGLLHRGDRVERGGVTQAFSSQEAAEGELNSNENGDQKSIQVDELDQDGADSKARPGEGAVRRRRKISLGLSSLEAYSNADNEARYSQAELDAKMETFQAEAAALHEKAILDLKTAYEVQVTVMQRALEASQKEVEKGRHAANICAEQEALTAELSQQLADFESCNLARLEQTEKELGDKTVQLEVITQQYLALKMQMNQLEISGIDREKALYEQIAELQLRVAEVDQQRKLVAKELEVVRSDEREKRNAAVLKMKNDMKALAEQQFAEANKTFHVVQQQLKQTKLELEETKKVAQRDNTQAKTSVDSITRQLEEAKRQADVYRQALVAKESEFANREESLTKGITAAQMEYTMKEKEAEKLRVDMINAARDRDAAQESLARLALRNGELQKEVADLNAVSNELMEMIEKQQSA